MSNILIAPIWHIEPILKSSTSFNVESIYLIIDLIDKKEQKNAIKLLKNSLGKIIKINTIKTNQYNILDIAKKIINIIDSKTSNKDKIYIDISSGRKPVSFGILFASYARKDRIKKIVYITEEDKKIISLPKLSFNLSNNQRSLLIHLNNNKLSSYTKLAEEIGLSRAMLYNNIKELINTGLIIETENGIELTEMGIISIM